MSGRWATGDHDPSFKKFDCKVKGEIEQRLDYLMVNSGVQTLPYLILSLSNARHFLSQWVLNVLHLHTALFEHFLSI